MNDRIPETEKPKLRDILGCCPPDREPTYDAEWAEALAKAQRDPELRAWHEQEKEFDRRIGARLKSLPVPADLRAKLTPPELSPQIIAFPWALLRNAAVFVVAGGLILWGITGSREEPATAGNPPNQPVYAQFSSAFYGELTSLFQREPEFDYFSENLAELRLRVKEVGGPEASEVPEAIDELQGFRCRLFNWEKSKVSLICMRKNDQSYHLFVIEDPTATPPTSPRTAPTFDQMDNWAFASWAGDGKTYVLGTRGSRSDLEPMF
jgi:hypothetical protein